MIKGIGCDILEIERVRKLVDNNNFMSTYYTEKELSYIKERANIAETATAIFCAKEAAAKAIGTGFKGFSPRDIEILHRENGMPYIALNEKASEAAKKCGIKTFHVSLSHCREYAAAYVTAEGDDTYEGRNG